MRSRDPNLEPLVRQRHLFGDVDVESAAATDARCGAGSEKPACLGEVEMSEPIEEATGGAGGALHQATLSWTSDTFTLITSFRRRAQRCGARPGGDLRDLPALRHLELEQGECPATAARAFGATWSSTLKSVHAQMNRVSVVALFDEGRLAGLRELTIFGDATLPLDDPGIRDVLRGGRLASLRSVSLDACRISNVDLFPFPDLRHLWLALDDPEVFGRLASPTLRMLRLSTEWSIPGVLNRLAQAKLPALEEVTTMARYPEDHSDDIPPIVRRAMPRLRRAVAD
jgi:hypothetical protein